MSYTVDQDKIIDLPESLSLPDSVNSWEAEAEQGWTRWYDEMPSWFKTKWEHELSLELGLSVIQHAADAYRRAGELRARLNAAQIGRKIGARRCVVTFVLTRLCEIGLLFRSAQNGTDRPNEYVMTLPGTES